MTFCEINNEEAWFLKEVAGIDYELHYFSFLFSNHQWNPKRFLSSRERLKARLSPLPIFVHHLYRSLLKFIVTGRNEKTHQRPKICGGCHNIPFAFHG